MNPTMEHLTTAELEAALGRIRQSPTDAGVVRLIVRRPAPNDREVVQEAELDPKAGLVGDSWGRRRGADADMQLTLMNVRVTELVAGDPDRWPLAGDQLYVDFDLSLEHLPPGSRLCVGAAEIEVSAEPHMGCRLFRERYGEDALRLVNSPDGRAWHLRGINAWVVKSGRVQVGDDVHALFD